ncbi:unnamed protein product, partial [Symbiodinium microadriaticum]
MSTSNSRIGSNANAGGTDGLRAPAQLESSMGGQAPAPDGTQDGSLPPPHKFYENLTNIEVVKRHCKELLDPSFASISPNECYESESVRSVIKSKITSVEKNLRQMPQGDKVEGGAYDAISMLLALFDLPDTDGRPGTYRWMAMETVYLPMACAMNDELVKLKQLQEILQNMLGVGRSAGSSGYVPVGTRKGAGKRHLGASQSMLFDDADKATTEGDQESLATGEGGPSTEWDAFLKRILKGYVGKLAEL